MVLFTSNVVIRLQEYVIWPVYCHYYLMTVTVIWSPLYDVAGQSFYTHFLLVIATSLSVEFFKNSIHLHSWFYLWEKKNNNSEISSVRKSVCGWHIAVHCVMLCSVLCCASWLHGDMCDHEEVARGQAACTQQLLKHMARPSGNQWAIQWFWYIIALHVF